MSDNLPPGVTEDMIPGNRPEDEAWDAWHEMTDDDVGKHGLTEEDAYVVWKIGLAAYLQLRNIRVKTPHDDPEQKPQRQDALNDQLRDLIPIATREGCYDAADYLRNLVEKTRIYMSTFNRS